MQAVCATYKQQKHSLHTGLPFHNSTSQYDCEMAFVLFTTVTHIHVPFAGVIREHNCVFLPHGNSSYPGHPKVLYDSTAEFLWVV